jgi:hypothetical protein
MDLLRIVSIVGNGAILLLVIELIRRGRLKERYALLWLVAGIFLLILSLSRVTLEFFSHLVGIYYSPSFLFLIAFVFLLMITMHFSVVISGLSEKNKKLAQEISLLRSEMEGRTVRKTE